MYNNVIPGMPIYAEPRTSDVEAAFTRAVDLAVEAATKLPEGCVNATLVQTLFERLCSVDGSGLKTLGEVS